MAVREDWSSLPDRELVVRASVSDTRPTAVEEICRRHYEPVLRHPQLYRPACSSSLAARVCCTITVISCSC
jgi:hypothetical protein